MCEAPEVSVSGYYPWAARPDSPTGVWRRELVGAIEEIRPAVKGRYGSPRMTAELNARGYGCPGNTVAEPVRGRGIRARTPERFARTTDSNHRQPAAADTLDRGLDPDGPDARRCAGIASIPTREGWGYRAVVEDPFSRVVVGWSMGESMGSRPVVGAPEVAIRRRRPGAGSLAHPGRGSQYAGEHHQRVLTSGGMVCSRGAVGQCRGDAPMGSFSGRMGCEIGSARVVATRDRARAERSGYPEVVYNRARRHSSRGVLVPGRV
jgi:transposase InsO family protein